MITPSGNEPAAAKRQKITDADAALNLIRIGGFGWVILTGFLTLTPVLSTETQLIVWRGFPYWTLGAALLTGSAWLAVAHVLDNWLLFVVGDFIVGAMCLTMMILMGVGSVHERASGLSVMLWSLPTALFMLNCVLRARWR